MASSLINKFRGAWFGSYLGAATTSPQRPQARQQAPFLAISKIAEVGVQSLVKLGYLDLEAWQQQLQTTKPALLSLARSLQISEVIRAALPVILFYHEQPQKLTLALLSTLDLWLHSPEYSDISLAVAEAIAFLLRKNPDPQKIITQTELGLLLQLPPQFWQELPCLELAIKEITRQTTPSCIPLAIACYCFLCTPEDFSLSIRRAKIAPQPELVTPLVGILSGAYNGLGGIPFNWYAESQDLSETSSLKSSITHLLNSSTQVLIGDAQYQLIDQLFAVWAGHYQTPLNTMSWQNQIVTTPTSK